MNWWLAQIRAQSADSWQLLWMSGIWGFWLRSDGPPPNLSGWVKRCRPSGRLCADQPMSPDRFCDLLLVLPPLHWSKAVTRRLHGLLPLASYDHLALPANSCDTSSREPQNKAVFFLFFDFWILRNFAKKNKKTISFTYKSTRLVRDTGSNVSLPCESSFVDHSGWAFGIKISCTYNEVEGFVFRMQCACSFPLDGWGGATAFWKRLDWHQSVEVFDWSFF